MKLTQKQSSVLQNTNMALYLMLEAEDVNSDDSVPLDFDAKNNDPKNQQQFDTDEQDQDQDAYADGFAPPPPSQNQQAPQKGQPQGQAPQNGQHQAPQDPRDVFADQIQGVEEKFVQFVLYDKLGELSSKINILQENIKNDAKDNFLELGLKLEHYTQYLNVLNELIFSMDTSVIYQLLGQIELELIELLQAYSDKITSADSDKSKQNIKNQIRRNR